MRRFDAVVVGAGPNGLAGAVELTRSGRRVLILEAADTIGGGTRTTELTLPGFLHDVCSAIHPMGAGSPFFRSAGVGDWIQPDIPMTHPLGGERVAALHRSLAETCDGLGVDGVRYRRVIEPLVNDADRLMEQVLGPLRIPRNPLLLGRFGALGMLPASAMARGLKTEEAKGIVAGLAAHAIAPFGSPLTGAIVEMFAVAAHAYGWPLVRGGSQRIAEELAAIVVAGGGEIRTGVTVSSLDELPEAPIVMLDTMPDAAIRIGRRRVGASARGRLGRWKTGPAVYKIDWALDGPIPWSDPLSGSAGTVHVGGRYAEVARAEGDMHRGNHPEKPFVIITQQSLFDPSRAPDENQTAWGYCHVPAGSTVNMTDAIEAQVERFAPGFRDCIIGRHVMAPGDYEVHNANYVGGDIAGGTFAVRRWLQVGAARSYRIGHGLYLCSSATPPGPGVHGMCGHHAALAALKDHP